VNNGVEIPKVVEPLRSKSSYKMWIRPFGEELGWCQNRTRRRIIPRRCKDSKSSGWNLGRNGDRRIQGIIPKRE
jgi:hypothetical protein